MRSSRSWILFLLFGVVSALACSGLAGSAPPDTTAGEPPAAEATSGLPSALPTSEIPVATPQPALSERRRLTLEFPAELRAGDSDLVRLTLEMDDLGNITPTAEIAGNAVAGEVIEIPNLYETHHVIAEARLDLAGMEVRPAELMGEPLAPGNTVTFYWSIHPQQAGVYRGTVWLYLRFLHKSTGEESRKAVSAQIVEIEAVNLLGMSGSFARTTGVVGSVVGTILGFPFFEDIVRLLLKQRNKLK